METLQNGLYRTVAQCQSYSLHKRQPPARHKYFSFTPPPPTSVHLFAFMQINMAQITPQYGLSLTLASACLVQSDRLQPNSGTTVCCRMRMEYDWKAIFSVCLFTSWRGRSTSVRTPPLPPARTRQGGHIPAEIKFPVFSLSFPCVTNFFPVFFSIN